MVSAAASIAISRSVFHKGGVVTGESQNEKLFAELLFDFIHEGIDIGLLNVSVLQIGDVRDLGELFRRVEDEVPKF